MEFFDVINERRSIRSFEDKTVPRRLIESCLNAARQAPSGTNAQPWRFLVAHTAETRGALAEAGYGQRCLATAPIITVLLGDRGFYKKRLRRAKELGDIGALTPDDLTLLESVYQKRSDGKEQNDGKIVANCMLAGEHYVLAAAALGLGACWVMLFDAEKVAAALGLDEKLNFPVALIPTGYSASGPIEPRPRYALSKIAWEERPEIPWEEEKDYWVEVDAPDQE